MPRRIAVIFYSRLLPELGLFEDALDRGKAFRKATKGVYLNGYYLVSMVLLVLAIIWLKPTVYSQVPLPPIITLCFLAAIIGFVSGYAPILISKVAIRHVLRKELNEKGIPVCMECGYLLRGLQINTCPECGKPFDKKLLQVRGT